ncbi:hypothetical protein L6452_43721 [Arctium lappa]|uniref:Uncharacterized protein n=1 Tax=Arctium lappa TaxID=4217 RepID=A0ACB8XE79_ARCLA|nr:hypothetical protein L6452_43721 [Arctium lappa]
MTMYSTFIIAPDQCYGEPTCYMCIRGLLRCDNRWGSEEVSKWVAVFGNVKDVVNSVWQFRQEVNGFQLKNEMDQRQPLEKGSGRFGRMASLWSMLCWVFGDRGNPISAKGGNGISWVRNRFRGRNRFKVIFGARDGRGDSACDSDRSHCRRVILVGVVPRFLEDLLLDSDFIKEAQVGVKSRFSLNIAWARERYTELSLAVVPMVSRIRGLVAFVIKMNFKKTRPCVPKSFLADYSSAEPSSVRHPSATPSAGSVLADHLCIDNIPLCQTLLI